MSAPDELRDDLRDEVERDAKEIWRCKEILTVWALRFQQAEADALTAQREAVEQRDRIRSAISEIQMAYSLERTPEPCAPSPCPCEYCVKQRAAEGEGPQPEGVVPDGPVAPVPPPAADVPRIVARSEDGCRVPTLTEFDALAADLKQAHRRISVLFEHRMRAVRESDALKALTLALALRAEFTVPLFVLPNAANTDHIRDLAGKVRGT